jgi:Hypervirulence associated proteins TUDOR domain
MTKQEFKQGDKVSWETPQGKTRGKVVKKLTSDTTVANEGQKGTEVKASEEDPRYLVESEKTGKQAAHKPDALQKA